MRKTNLFKVESRYKNPDCVHLSETANKTDGLVHWQKARKYLACYQLAMQYEITFLDSKQ